MWAKKDMPFYFLFFLNSINSCLYLLQIAAAGLLNIINTRSWASNRFELGTSRENTEINKGVSVSNPYIEKKKWGELHVVRRWGYIYIYIYNQVSCLGSGIPSLVGGLGSKVHLSVMEDGLYL